MRRPAPCVLLGLSLLLCAFPVYAFDMPHLWSQSHGGPNTEAARAIAVDAAGNVFITGFYGDDANFGGPNLDNPAPGGDMFIAKYSPAGVHQWSRGWGGANFVSAYGIKVDGAGAVVVTGYFAGTVDFGGGALVSAGDTDIFLAKYTNDGAYVWSQRFGNTGEDYGLAVAIDAANNIFLTGYFNGIVNFGGVNYASAGLEDMFLAKYNGAGAHQWSRRMGSVGVDAGRGLAVDGAGNVFMTGSFAGTVDFGGGNLVSAGLIDIVLAKFSGVAGAHQWSKRFGSVGDDLGTSVAVNGAGHVFATGYFTILVNFGGGNMLSAGLTDVYLARFDGVGNHVASERAGGAGEDAGMAITVDPAGNSTVTGYFSETATFNGVGVTSLGNYDMFLYSSPDFFPAHGFIRRAGYDWVDVGLAVAADASGNVFATGYFNDQINFGGANLQGGAGEDVFVVKYGGTSTEPIISSITDIGNDQGRKVKIVFSRSGQDDTAASLPVVAYEAYRQIAAPPMPAPPAGGEPLLDTGWTHVGSVSAHGKSEYSIDAPTIGDSTIAEGQYLSTFFIRAATAWPAIHFDSAPDDGYSVDNLAPGIPDNLIYSGGNLDWSESEAEDFDYFTVYGSNSLDFSGATLIGYTVSSDMDVSGSPYVFYCVTATDFSGNEGKCAQVNTLSDTPGTPERYVLSVSNFPNPFNPATTVSYTVPSRGHVAVTVYDARGAHVATLFDGERSTGAYRVEWNGRAVTGTPVSSGIYFARIEHNGATRTKKMVLLK